MLFCLSIVEGTSCSVVKVFSLAGRSVFIYSRHERSYIQTFTCGHHLLLTNILVVFSLIIFHRDPRTALNHILFYHELLRGQFLTYLFVPNEPFLYPLKTFKNLMVFWCFKGVEKGCIGNEWIRFWLGMEWAAANYLGDEVFFWPFNSLRKFCFIVTLKYKCWSITFSSFSSL